MNLDRVPRLLALLSLTAGLALGACGGEISDEPSTAPEGWGMVIIDSGTSPYAMAAFMSRKKEELAPLALGTCSTGGALASFVGDGTGAGRISVKAGARSVELLAPDASSKTYRGTLNGPLDPSVAIEVHAQGGTVPAFDASLLPVQLIDLTARVDGSDPSESALELTWEPVADDPHLDRLSLNLNGDGSHVFCTVDARAGRFVVPKDQFREVATRPFGHGGASPVVKLTATPAHSVIVHTGNYEVSVVHSATSAFDVPIR